MLRKLDVMKLTQEEKKSKHQSINQTPPAPSLNQPKQQSPKKQKNNPSIQPNLKRRHNRRPRTPRRPPPTSITPATARKQLLLTISPHNQTPALKSRNPQTIGSSRRSARRESIVEIPFVLRTAAGEIRRKASIGRRSPAGRAACAGRVVREAVVHAVVVGDAVAVAFVIGHCGQFEGLGVGAFGAGFEDSFVGWAG